MAEAVANALAIIAEVPEVDQTLTLCGFVNPVHHFYLIDLEDINSLDGALEILWMMLSRTWQRGMKLAFRRVECFLGFVVFSG
jgi:hypothetical protein